MKYYLLIFLLMIGAVEGASFALFTTPKSGTHLVIKTLRFRGYHPTQLENEYRAKYKYFSMHPHKDPERVSAYRADLDTSILINVRDARDIAVSMVPWFADGPGASPFVTQGRRNHQEWYALPYLDKIKAFFQPEEWGLSVLMYNCKEMLKWSGLGEGRVYVTSFEKLVGPQGGGNLSVQKNEVYQIFRFLSIPISRRKASRIASQIYGGTATYRIGQIGKWKEIFDEELCELTDTQLGSYMRRFGYPLSSELYHQVHDKNQVDDITTDF